MPQTMSKVKDDIEIINKFILFRVIKNKTVFKYLSLIYFTWALMMKYDLYLLCSLQEILISFLKSFERKFL